MKIGIDAKRAFHNKTGLGNYSRTLIHNLTTYYPDEQYFYFTPNDQSSYNHLFDPNQIITPSGRNPLWRSFGIKHDISKTGIELFHGLSNELPFGIDKIGIPSIVTIHDVIFDMVKEDFPWHDRAVYRMKTRRCLKESTKIIAISKATRQELIQRFGATPEKIRVIYQPIDGQFLKQHKSDDVLATIKVKYNLPNQFLLYVGALMKRKNILPMIQSWELLPDEDKIPLIIFGNGTTYKEKVSDYIRSRRLEKWIQLRDPVPFQHLPFLYRLANTVIYPSLCEGFGLPVLEALACGAKVITSDISSMPEAGGHLPIYVNPHSIDSIANGIIQSNTSTPMDPTALSRHLSQFDSARLTEQIMNLYHEVSEK